MNMIKPTSIFLFLLIISHLGYSRLAKENQNLISDGVDHAKQYSPIIELNLQQLGASTVSCTPIYSFLPCTTDPFGLLLLVAVYEYLLYVGDSYVNAGSELFFQTFGPGLFGASLFHILGTIPMVVVTLASGLSVAKESAEQQATMGMSILAGSAVMLLTLIWGLCVAFGSFDLSEDLNSSNKEHMRPFKLTGFGVKTDDDTRKTAIVMILSMIPFLILQLAKILNSYLATRVTILVSLLVTLAFLFAYCIYQVFKPWIQNRRFEYLLSKFVKDKLLVLLTSHGIPNLQLIRQIFREIDKDGDGNISTAELRVLILGIQLEDYFGLDSAELLQKVMEIFDTSGDDRINVAEFERGILKYISDTNESFVIKDHHKKANKEEWRMVCQGSAKKPWRNYFTATVQVLVGTIMLLLLASPLTGTVGDLATAINIPSFYVSYFLIPLALNMRMALALITSARLKTQNSISLSFSEIYSSVFMNNMMSLMTFLVLVYIRDLPWDVSAEVLVVLVICTMMGVCTLVFIKFPFWTSFVAFVMYLMSLLLLYVLITVCGWS